MNSPGGSAFASDVIARAIVQLRAAGKPVIVSMGDVAASGGYYIAAPADVIYAEPSTVTRLDRRVRGSRSTRASW